MLGAESESDEQRAGEESDNLFSRVSRRCCSYAASFFVYHIRIGEAFFLPAGPWDQTGFHRRGAVTEYMTKLERDRRSFSRDGTFRARETYFSRINLPKENLLCFDATFRHALRSRLSFVFSSETFSLLPYPYYFTKPISLSVRSKRRSSFYTAILRTLIRVLRSFGIGR